MEKQTNYPKYFKSKGVPLFKKMLEDKNAISAYLKAGEKL